MKKLMTLGAVCLAALAMPLSFTGPAVALPAIASDLGGSPVALSWVTNAFMLAFGSCLMAAGALADAHGRKRLFVGGSAAFALASVASSLAPTLWCLDLLRGLQGIAAAAAFSGGTAALAQEFEGRARTQAFSLLGTTFGIGLAFGPVLAGSLIALAGWRAVFLGVALLASLGLAAGLRCMHESRDPQASGLDWPGALSFTAALTLFTDALLQAPDLGWHSAAVRGLLAGALLLMVAFVMIETRVRRPMLDLSLFRYPRFIGVQFLAAAPAYSYVVLQVLLPLRFIGIEGLDAMAAGRLMIALSAPMLVLPLAAGWLTRWFSAGLISGAGLLVCAGGLLWLAQALPGQAPAQFIAPMLLIGLGISLPWGLMDGLAVSVVPKERAGMATGIFSTTRVAGEGIALAVVGAVLAMLAQARLPAATPEAAHLLAMGDLARAAALLPGTGPAVLVQAYGSAFHTLLYLLAAITVLSAVMVFGFLGRSRKLPVHQAAACEAAA